MPEEIYKPTTSRPAAYAMLAGATIGTGILAVTAPEALAAGAGSIGASAAVFITPFWRFIKRVNELYIDTATYVHEDANKLRKRFGYKEKIREEAPPKTHKQVFSRPIAYGILASAALTTTFLAVVAPGILGAAFGAVVVSGASFTKPVIDLVEKVNKFYGDAFHYLKKDVFRFKSKIPELLPVEPNHEIDQSIYAPITDLKKPYSKAGTYGLLAAGVVATVLLGVYAPAVIVGALGSIAGSAISYTSPALQFIKKVNKVYDKTEGHIIEDLDIADTFGMEPKKPDAKKGINIPKPVAYVMAAGAVVGVGVLAVYAPTVLTAALGSIAGCASSFTDPVLKQVGKVNDFYIDACSYLKSDWDKVAGRKVAVEAPKPAEEPKVAEQPKVSETAPTVQTPTPEAEKAPGVTVDFNKAAPKNDNNPQPVVTPEKKPDEVAQPQASVKRKVFGIPFGRNP